MACSTGMRFNECRRPDALFGANYGAAAPTMNELDLNGDGKVTRDELAAYFRRIGATPFQVPWRAVARGKHRDQGFQLRSMR